MGAIVPNTKAGRKKEAAAEFLDAKAEAAIQSIDADLALLGSSPTNTQILQILGRVLNRQKKIIRFLQRTNN